MLDTIFSSPTAWGLLILRLGLAVTFLVHGWMKVDPNGPVKSPSNFALFLKQMGVPLPLFFAWVVALLETVGVVFLVLGLATPILAIGFAVDMLVAALLAKRRTMNAKFMDPKGTGWEFEFALMMSALALFFTGAGRISLDYLLGIVVPDSLVLYAGALLIVALIAIALLINQGRRATAEEQAKTA